MLPKQVRAQRTPNFNCLHVLEGFAVPAHSIKGFVIAGERSGVGKTILTLALAKLLQDRGLRVQCFKVGPDFIDPGYHSIVTGRTSRNLDGWMMGKDNTVRCFEENMHNADIAIVEGVMGLFDGYDGRSEDGSTAQIAKWLNLPIILVVDGSSMARTAGALVFGFERYDPAVRITGVIFNKVASTRHYEYLRDGVMDRCNLDVLGYIPRGSEWHIPERHLGLVMAYEHDSLGQSLQSLCQQMQQTVDIDSIIAYTRSDHDRDHCENNRNPSEQKNIVTIGIARDEGFCFYYQDNIDLLQDYGARIVCFSPIHDAALPGGLDGLYLGGGYPELYAAQLHKNRKMRQAVLSFCRSGKPVYAECGGFIYLLQAIRDKKNKRYEMAGFFPANAVMRPRLQRLGYVEIEAQNNCPFMHKGDKARGHEFHYSDISAIPPDINRCYTVYRKRGAESFAEGYQVGNVLAGYVHLHFASHPDFALNFIRVCQERKRGK